MAPVVFADSKFVVPNQYHMFFIEHFTHFLKPTGATEATDWKTRSFTFYTIVCSSMYIKSFFKARKGKKQGYNNHEPTTG